jgi:transposase
MGGWETPLAAALAATWLTVVLVNPHQVPAYARAVGGMAKTDHLDTGVLCYFSREQQSADPQLPRAAQSQW